MCFLLLCTSNRALVKHSFREGIPLQNFLQSMMLRALFFRGLVVRMLPSPPSLLARYQLCSNPAPCCVVSWGGFKRLESLLGGSRFGSCLGSVPVRGLSEHGTDSALVPLGEAREAAAGAPPSRDGRVLAPPAAASPLDL